MCSASALPSSLVGLCCSQPPCQGDGCDKGHRSPCPGAVPQHVCPGFPLRRLCRRLPWDFSPPLFSGPSSRGRMLSRVEEANEPTLRSQLGPTELEQGHPGHTGVSSAAGVPEQGFGAECFVRDMSHGMQLSPPCLTACSAVKHDPGCAEDLCPGTSARPCTGRHLWYLCAILSGAILGARRQLWLAPAALWHGLRSPGLLQHCSALSEPKSQDLTCS